MRALSQTEFDALSDSEKNDYLKKREDHLNMLMRGTVVLSSLLVEWFDELENAGYARQRLKQVLKLSKKESEAYLDRIFDKLENTLPSSSYVQEVSGKVEELLIKNH
jgi:hypothetical protein